MNPPSVPAMFIAPTITAVWRPATSIVAAHEHGLEKPAKKLPADIRRTISEADADSDDARISSPQASMAATASPDRLIHLLPVSASTPIDRRPAHQRAGHNADQRVHRQAARFTSRQPEAIFQKRRQPGDEQPVPSGPKEGLDVDAPNRATRKDPDE